MYFEKIFSRAVTCLFLFITVFFTDLELPLSFVRGHVTVGEGLFPGSLFYSINLFVCFSFISMILR